MNNETIQALQKKIAMLQDGYNYQKDMADLYAKKLKEIWSWLDDEINDIENTWRYAEYAEELLERQKQIQEIKNNIPESALNR